MTAGEAGKRDGAVAIVALLGLAAHPVLGPHAPALAHWAVCAGSVAIVAASWRTGDAARSVAAMTAALGVATQLPILWQPAMLVALAAFVVLGRVVPAFRPPGAWRARGTLPLGWTLLVGGVTPFALGAWMVLFHPDLHAVRAANVPELGLPLPVIAAGGVVFAFVNAALEELLWRGVLQDRLAALFGDGAAVGLQAASFGVQHLWGVPRGIAGVVLAGVWAVMLGLLRRRSGGLLAPFAAHVVADATIAVIVIGFVK
jgi:membrane protease YdiL (CAAX protease family)